MRRLRLFFDAKFGRMAIITYLCQHKNDSVLILILQNNKRKNEDTWKHYLVDFWRT